MSIYLIGDVQGCDGALQRLLDTLAFSPSRDTLYLLGDLVNRGPDSAGVLRRLIQLEGSAHCLLGNHDLSLLALAAGVRRPHRLDTLEALLAAPDRDAMLHWLRHRRMAIHAHGILMVHAGVLPAWTLAQTLALAQEVEVVLRGPGLHAFLPQMYGCG
jgi:bis(5'-nucleosyl)-tetraphosphatase (symmetrical)